jgi:flagellin-like hook-associated protein FlgL
MQLTNFSFLNARNDFLESIAKRKVAADRIETGKRLEQTTKDLGAISQAAKQKLQLLNDGASINNLKNLRSYLYSQEVSLNRVYEMYDKIEQLAIKAANPITTQEERKDLQIEFEDYQKQLEVIMQSEYNGAALFSSTILCGGRKEVNIDELNMLSSTWDHAVKTQKVDLGSPAGTISFRVNSGTNGDIYRIWMGDNLVFSMGGFNPDMKSQGAHHSTQQDTKNGSPDLNWDIPGTLANGKAGNGSGGDRWRTTGSAGNGNDDRVEVTFGPGQPTTFKLYLGDGNDPSLNDFSGAVSTGVAGKLYKPGELLNPDTDTTKSLITRNADGDVLTTDPRWSYEDGKGWSWQGDASEEPFHYTSVPGSISTNDLPESFDEKTMYLQIETSSIGIIYDKGGASSNNDADGTGTEGVEFMPATYIKEVPVDSPENKIYLDPKGFETLDTGQSLALPSLAQEVVDMMRGNTSDCGCKTYFGEMRCLLESRIGILGSEYQRVDQEIAELEDQLVANEAAYGRITGSDMAAEATEFAKQSIKTNMAVEVIGNSTRLKDVLIPLTTEHFRSSVLSAGI